MKRIIKRSFFYVRQGYALAALPFAFLGYASSIYYLAIKNILLLHQLFPHFSDFLIVAAITLPTLCGLIGYVYMKRSWLFNVAQTIHVESNPYATVKIQPVVIPFWEVFVELAKQHGIDTAKIEEILEESKHLSSL